MDLAEVTLALDAAAAYRTDSIDATERDSIPSASVEFGTAEARMVAPQLLDLLSPEVREIVQLRFYQDLSQSEIAARVGVSQMQVSRVLRKALATLREHVPLD
jgi:RNA polymerase sigma-B factor